MAICGKTRCFCGKTYVHVALALGILFVTLSICATIRAIPNHNLLGKLKFNPVSLAETLK